MLYLDAGQCVDDVVSGMLHDDVVDGILANMHDGLNTE